MSSADPGLLTAVRDYYEGRLREFGSTARGVDWKSEESQRQRFEMLLPERLDEVESLLDYGCGYGALLPFLRDRGWQGRYVGFDVSPEMISTAKRENGDESAEFVDEAPESTFDCTVASGIFNVRLEFDDGRWESYVDGVLDAMWNRTASSMSFNMLTSYSDAHLRRPDLFYGDPARYFDRCVRHYSRNVTLRHGYGLYEFTVEVGR